MFPYFFIIILLIITYVVFWIFKNYTFWKTFYSIPGPRSCPIVGNSINLLKYSTKEKAFQLLRKMKEEYGPVWRLQIFYFYGIGITEPDDLEVVLSNPHHLEKNKIYEYISSWLCSGLLTSAGNKWHARRKFLTPAFHFNILKQFLPIIVDHTDDFTEQLMLECDKGHTNVTNLITEMSLKIICETIMGVKLNFEDEKEREYIKSIHRFGEILMKRIFCPWMGIDWIYYNFIPTGREEIKLTKLLHNFSMDVIKKRKVNFTPAHVTQSHDDVYKSKKRLAMLDLLLTAKLDGVDIDDEGIREEVDTFMFEGHDTTSACLCFTLFLIANHSDVQDKLVEEIDEILGKDKWPPTYQELQQFEYLERCIKESLRLYPSVVYIGRNNNKNVKLKSGYVLPKGSLTHMLIYDLHRNPKIYPNPEKYDPDRFLPEATEKRHPYAYIPFSAGPRNCIGQRFALLEIRTVIIGILRKFRLNPIDTTETLTLYSDFVLRPTNGIKVQFRGRP